MYCSACGTLIAPGLSYCNRCGMGLKEPGKAKSGAGPIIAFLVAIDNAIVAIVFCEPFARAYPDEALPILGNGSNNSVSKSLFAG